MDLEEEELGLRSASGTISYVSFEKSFHSYVCFFSNKFGPQRIITQACEE